MGEKQNRGEPITPHILQKNANDEEMVGKRIDVRGNCFNKTHGLGDLEPKPRPQLIGFGLGRANWSWILLGSNQGVYQFRCTGGLGQYVLRSVVLGLLFDLVCELK